MTKTAKPAGAREAIEIARIKFIDDRQEGAGIGLASVCTSQVVDGRRLHRIKYLPWLRAFRVELYDRPGGGGDMVDAVQIPEHRVLWWAMTADQTAKSAT